MINKMLKVLFCNGPKMKNEIGNSDTIKYIVITLSQKIKDHNLEKVKNKSNNLWR